MLWKLNYIIIYTLVAFGLSYIFYPGYIRLLQRFKANKTLRIDAASWGKAEIFNKLHAHKAWTPTMGWWMFLLITALLVLVSFVLQHFWYISNSLVTRQETYILLFSFFGMGIWGLIDDWLNIKVKLLWMVALAAWVSYWFYAKLWVDYIQLRPLFDGKLTIWLLYPVITFFLTLAIVNAINITDGLDGLAGWMMIILLWVMSVITFIYWWYLATTLLGIITWTLLAFLLFNINPAKVFMGDSWALALWWLLSALVYLLNLRDNFFIPFMVLFGLFWVELGSSFLQIFWKKVFKRKLFAIAPFHHLLEHRWMKEYTIVMKFWVIQWILACITLIIIFYQLH
jgi:phospho-N-acetylmuramoyl-pentapeptide-transferase